MKIIHVISNLGNGGAERLVVDLANAQSALGHDVVIISFRDVDSSCYTNELGSVRLKSFSKQKGLDLSLPFAIFSFLKKEKPEVVNCHLPSVFIYIILSLMILKKVRFFYTIHSDPIKEEPRKIIRNWRRFFIVKNRLVPVAISNQIKLKFEELYQIDQVSMIENGRGVLHKTDEYDKVSFEINVLKPKEDTKVFISVGRISKEKNHKLLVDVFIRLKEQNENVILLIVGNDYGWGLLEELEAIKADNTYFLGSKNNVADYLYASDVFCMSSLYEGLPISIIEAISIGLPVVSTDVGGIPDVIADGENGFLVKSLNANDYYNVIKKFISLDKESIRQISDKNRKLFNERYNIKITAEQYLETYKRCSRL